MLNWCFSKMDFALNKNNLNLPRVNTVCSSRSPKYTAKILFNFLPQIIACPNTLLVIKGKLLRLADELHPEFSKYRIEKKGF